jgi:predicted permease
MPIFLITLVGALIKRNWLKSDELWLGLEKLSYFLLFPMALFQYASSVNTNDLDISKLVISLILSTTLVSILLIFYQIKINCDKIQFTSIFQGSVRYNTYIFLGLTAPIFGVQGLAIASVVSSIMIIFTNILSVLAFSYYIKDNSISDNHKESAILLLKLIIKNPLIIASIVGSLFNYYSIELAPVISQTISSIAYAAFPIGMLNIGASLRFVTEKALFRDILVTTIFKLVLLPIITIIVLKLCSVGGVSRSIGILYSCLPCASTSFILSRQLGGDPESMASIITFTTIFSLFSLTIFMNFI